MKVLIIGGVAAGTKTAAKIKRLNRDADVTIVSKGRDISYAGCGLPYYVGGIIESKDSLIVNSPSKFTDLTEAKVLTEREIFKLDTENKKAYARNLRTGAEEEFAFDSCVISVGASPIVPNINGVNLGGVFTMRLPEDAIELRDYIKNNDSKKAVVVGGGFIGIETAENLKAQGLDVTVIDMADRIMTNFDLDISDYCRRNIVKNGIKVITSTKLEAIEGQNVVTAVKTDKGLIKADVVVLSMGIRPNTVFLKDTGIDMTEKGLIKVDDRLSTSIKDIYAAGDCAAVKNMQTGEHVWSPMGSSANLEGRVLANVICGRDKKFSGVLGTAVVKLTGFNAARTGLGEEQALKLGYDVVTAVTVTDDKAHYYAGSSLNAIKVIADRKSHKLLGLQAAGQGAVDKWVDVAVMAISMNAKLEDMENLDLSYAPPFSTAINPVVTAVNVLMNKINGDMDSMTPIQYMNGEAEGYKFIDATNENEVGCGKHVVLTSVTGPIAGYDKNDKILLVCRRGRLAYLMQNRLKHFGYTNTLVLEGANFFNDVKNREKKTTLLPEDITKVKAHGFLHNKGTNNFNCRVITRNGKITAEESQKIAEAAQKFGNGHIAMTTRLTMEIEGVPYENIEPIMDFLAEEGLETGGTGSKVRPVVSCKGTTCQYGLIDTYELSEKIHKLFYKGYREVKLPHKFKIAVGGCPNNCVKPNLNDLGIIGQRIPNYNPDLCKGCKVCQIEQSCPIKIAKLEGGKLVINENACNHCGRCVGKCPFKAIPDGTYGYKVYIGGRWGKKVASGQELNKIFTSEEEVLAIVEKAILLFREQGITGERFSDTIARIGFENVQSQLISDDILKRKEEIIGAKVHLVGGATC